jgi:hypothetical protein
MHKTKSAPSNKQEKKKKAKSKHVTRVSERAKQDLSLPFREREKEKHPSL